MILAHPQVQQVFIVPLDDAEYGQRPVAVVECDDGCELSALAAWSAERLARFQQPVRWLRLPETLKTAGLRFRAGRCASGSAADACDRIVATRIIPRHNAGWVERGMLD